MSVQQIPNEFHDLFEKLAFAHLATLMPDGTSQVTPVWIDYDGKYILVNTARGRQKDRNMKRDPMVALSIQDPENPYRYIQVRGRVAEIATEGADAHIDEMAKKYLSQERYPYRQAGEERVLYKIEPIRLSLHG